MTEMLNANEQVINSYLNNVLNYINNGQVKDAYHEWNKF
jgi:hypothetical protein